MAAADWRGTDRQREQALKARAHSQPMAHDLLVLDALLQVQARNLLQVQRHGDLVRQDRVKTYEAKR